MTANLPEKSSFYLQPGYLCVNKEPGQMHAVVGSCVVVCLWDRRLAFGGMSHFQLPSTSDPARATPRFGNVATSKLVAMMFQAGSHRKDLVAQILGGGAPRGARGADIGAENVRIARQVLRQRGIAVVSEDTGGNMGRKIVFDVATGHVMILKVHEVRREDWLVLGP